MRYQLFPKVMSSAQKRFQTPKRSYFVVNKACLKDENNQIAAMILAGGTDKASLFFHRGILPQFSLGSGISYVFFARFGDECFQQQ